MKRGTASRLGIALLLGAQTAGALAAGIPWTPDWQAAQAEAKRANKLVMVDFYTEW